MRPVSVNTDPTTSAGDNASLTLEPAAAADGGDDQQPEVRADADERTLEEAGYGYGV